MNEAIARCRRQLLVAGSPLAASLHFAPRQLQDAILALRAVIAEIAAVPDTVSEGEIAHRKLAWWRDALRERAAHPAIEALVASSAAERLDPALFDPLIAGAAAAVDSPRFERSDQAWEYCLAIGGPAASLEAALVDEASGASDAWPVLGGFACQVRLVRDLGVDARANRWLVPLDLQADYQVARQDIVDGAATRGFDGLVRAWLDDGLVRVTRALEGLSPQQRWAQRHLLVAHAIDRRLARALARRPRRIIQTRLQTGHLGNVWCAWRAARRLRRGLAVDQAARISRR